MELIRTTEEHHVVDLRDPDAPRAHLTGSKASALAVAAAHDLPVLPGFVLTTAFVRRLDEGEPLDAVAEEARKRWGELSAGGSRPVIVRSSSPSEDLAASSMAGRYESVVGVQGWDEFLRAVRTVVDSRQRAAIGSPDLTPDHPIAVLVQPMLDARVGGVMFGVEPVTGRTDRIVVAAVEGQPEQLVSGRASGSRSVLDRKGGLVERDRAQPRLSKRDRKRLAVLSAAAERVFGAPQDVEWAIDGAGRLHLLQSRPVTTTITGVPSGPVFGPGPVAETFPEPLARLERDLWVDPVRDAIRIAVRLAGSSSRRTIDRSPVVVCIGGRVAVDLELIGAQTNGRTSGLRRRLRTVPAAWRIGRLRGALPALADEMVHRVDDELLRVGPLEDLTDSQLVGLLSTTRQALTSVHGYEMLIGLLVGPGAAHMTSASVALRVLAHARASGLEDDEIVPEHPVVLALVPPRIAATTPLPQVREPPPWRPSAQTEHVAVLRESLRMRARWLQELSARAAWTLGTRWHAAGRLAAPDDIARVPLDELPLAARDLAFPLASVLDEGRPDSPPLPAQFRCSDLGAPVPVAGRAGGGGTGAGGGRARGTVTLDDRDPPAGSVLVVRTLHPGLAPVLGRLAGLVVETGSVLAHVAILAREADVATVVGLAGATERFDEGDVVDVDGTTGVVEVVNDERQVQGG